MYHQAIRPRRALSPSASSRIFAADAGLATMGRGVAHQEQRFRTELLGLRQCHIQAEQQAAEVIKAAQARRAREKEAAVRALAQAEQRAAEVAKAEQARNAREKEAAARARANLEKGIREAEYLAEHERYWARIKSRSIELGSIRMEEFPWCTFGGIVLDSVTEAAVRAFIFHPYRLAVQTRKDIIRKARLRWFPDKCVYPLSLIAETDREVAKALMLVISQHLNAIAFQEGFK